jgi:SAM-dependent methyltransferase
MSAASEPSPALVFETLSAHQHTAALRTAIEIDLFRAVGDGPADAATLAQRCGASERGIRILCDYLTIMGFLTKEDGVYGHTPTSRIFLDPRSPASLASMAKFIANPQMMEPASHLTEIVRSGRTVLPGQGTVDPNNPAWVEFAHSMAPMMAPMTAPLGQAVLSRRNGPMRVLDIAAGHGLFGIEIAKQNPEARIVALDWAPVLEVAAANARNAGVADRYERLPGSAFEVDYGEPYDAVLLTNFLHHFDVPTCTDLLRKVHAALKPDGIAATLEFVPNDDRISPPMPAGFAMIMLLTTPSGDAYTYRELARMHRDAGFAAVEDPIPMGAHALVIARR